MSERRFFSPWPRLLAVAASLVWSAGGLRAQSDTAETPPDQPGDCPPRPAWESPFLSPTNSASASFLDSHPNLEQPPPPLETNLSLQSGAPAQSRSAGAEASPDRFSFPEGDPDELPNHLLVVYNSDDPSSRSLAEYYATRREIPPERVLGIDCPTTEDITRSQYEKTVREPIISYIFRKDWMARRSVSVHFGGEVRDLLLATRNNIWAIVLIRGIPLRIAEDPTLLGSLENIPSLQTNAAAVDSELALLPIFGLPAGGFVPNLFFDRTGSGLVRAGPELATKLILVTRLDGPRPADVRRMIDDTLYAEENRLAGLAVIDRRGLTDAQNPYTMGDDWLRTSQAALVQDGWTVRADDTPAVLPPSDPLDHVAIYLGWYHAGACGPWITAPNRFVRGAIAYHLHSFSATTVRSATEAWVGPLIAHGAAATMGCVYEPYLDLTPHLDIFTHRLLDGDSFAEAAYASQKALSWMVTVIGDPLYRPFQKSLDATIAGLGAGTSSSSDHYDWLLLQQLNRALVRDEIPQNTTSLRHYLDVPGAVAQEGLGDLLENLNDSAATDAALAAYREAANLDAQPIDRIRVGLKLAQLDERDSRHLEAQNQLRTLRDLFPLDAAVFGVPPAPEVAAIHSARLTLHSDPTSDDLAPAPKPPAPPKPATPLSGNDP